MPRRTAHPIFDNRTRKDSDDQLLDAGVGNSISQFVDFISPHLRKMGRQEEENENE
jgi:hypothetical protein